jgi:hypothetical protein
VHRELGWDRLAAAGRGTYRIASYRIVSYAKRAIFAAVLACLLAR